MGKIIGIINPKGGVGKSAIAAHMALQMHTSYNHELNSKFVCVFDSDIPQFSVSNLRKEEQRVLKMKVNSGNTYYDSKFVNLYSQIKPFSIFEGSIKDAISKFDVLRKNFEFTFVDVVGSVNIEGYDQEFISNFDFIIIPMNKDFEVIRSTIAFVKNIIDPIYKAKGIGDYSILFNAMDKRQESTYTVLKEDLIEKGYKVFNSTITRKDKYVTPYLHESSGSYSTLYPKYDRDMYALIEEFNQKINNHG